MEWDLEQLEIELVQNSILFIGDLLKDPLVTDEKYREKLRAYKSAQEEKLFKLNHKKVRLLNDPIANYLAEKTNIDYVVNLAYEYGFNEVVKEAYKRGFNA